MKYDCYLVGQSCIKCGIDQLKAAMFERALPKCDRRSKLNRVRYQWWIKLKLNKTNEYKTNEYINNT